MSGWIDVTVRPDVCCHVVSEKPYEECGGKLRRIRRTSGNKGAIFCESHPHHDWYGGGKRVSVRRRDKGGAS